MKTDRSDLGKAVTNRFAETDFYKELNEAQRGKLSARLLECEEYLLPNLIEWVNDEPFSDIYINDKYCIGAVMKIRMSDNFVDAFIALDNYAKDPDTELAIWQRWS